MLAADLHGSCAETVLGEDARHRGACVEQEHRQVLAIGLAHAGFGNTNANAIDRQQISGDGSGKIHGHFCMFLEK
ncbi:hypothetical protein SDC9_135706 [bioreactor metagenome]|uniref:Uncharacterized protein n=1 Tax=bioreactor metagenome TaxID=1076179 RepID=A0A645DJ42_9ZZZZ